MKTEKCAQCTTPTTCRQFNECGWDGRVQQGQAEKLDSPNPKAAWGDLKANMIGIPSSALIALGQVMGGGAHKYGIYNYRRTDINASTYQGAIARHDKLFFDGEDIDPIDCGKGKPPGSGANHLICIMASCALLYDAQVNGRMVDDRSKTGEVRRLMDEAAAGLQKFKDAHDQFILDTTPVIRNDS